jgi:hypothetical protein
MPSNSQLVYRLGVRFSSSDPLQPEDLASAKKTRQANHRELIRRRPGQYYRRWLSKRLGVSSRTTQRYDSQLHIHVRPMFQRQPITWDTLNRIPDEPVPGMFLMDDSGRRYPAKRDIAVHLLPGVWALYLMRQEANFYSLDEPRVVFNQVWKLRREQQAQIEQRISTEQGRAENIPAAPLHPAALPRSGVPPPTIATITPRQQRQQPEQMPKPGKSGKPAPKLTKRAARQPLSDARQEALARRVYTLINARTPDRQNRISQASARRAVFTYGTYAVENALKTLSSRRNITKPAGFFMTILRSTQHTRAGR